MSKLKNELEELAFRDLEPAGIRRFVPKWRPREGH
jgi:hypothetical protein